MFDQEYMNAFQACSAQAFVEDRGRRRLQKEQERREKEESKKSKRSSNSKSRSIFTTVIGTAVTYFPKTSATQLARNLTKKSKK